MTNVGLTPPTSIIATTATLASGFDITRLAWSRNWSLRRSRKSRSLATIDPAGNHREILMPVKWLVRKVALVYRSSSSRGGLTMAKQAVRLTRLVLALLLAVLCSGLAKG